MTLIVTFAAMGAAMGSFLNLCVDRLPRGESLLRPASRCDACGVRLRWFHMVPVASYLALRGRCAACHARIPPRALAMEASCAGLLGYLGYTRGVDAASLAIALYILVFVLIAFIDLEHGVIPNKVVYPAAVAALGLSVLLPDVGLLRAAIGGAAGFAAMLVVYVAARGGMGGGDVKLAGLVGLCVGAPLLAPALLIAVISGGAFALLLLALGRRGRRDTIPFGPFLVAGALAALLWGPALLDGWQSAFRGLNS